MIIYVLLQKGRVMSLSYIFGTCKDQAHLTKAWPCTYIMESEEYQGN